MTKAVRSYRVIISRKCILKNRELVRSHLTFQSVRSYESLSEEPYQSKLHVEIPSDRKESFIYSSNQSDQTCRSARAALSVLSVVISKSYQSKLHVERTPDRKESFLESVRSDMSFSQRSLISVINRYQ